MELVLKMGLMLQGWVVGAEREVNVNGVLVGEALIMKIWPKRAEAKLTLSTELNSQLDSLMKKHCS